MQIDYSDWFMHPCIMLTVSKQDGDLIVNGEKTVIVQRKCPEQYMITLSQKGNHRLLVYLFNKEYGVFAECHCKITLSPRWYKVSVEEYKKNPEKYSYEEEILNDDVVLDGTCMTMQEYRDYVGIGKHCLFKINDLFVYNEPMPIDRFYIGLVGKNGLFSSDEKFKSPRGWCYALKKKV